uniref:Transmembrane protein n=1 Tax=Strongyloides stercoralis TaxID=6248 RepID=A0A0K0EHT9_STRER
MAGTFFAFSLLFTIEWLKFKTYKEIFAQVLVSSLFSFILYLLNIILLFKNHKIALVKDNNNLKSCSMYNERRSTLLYQPTTSNTYRDFIDPYCTLSFDRKYENNYGGTIQQFPNEIILNEIDSNGDLLTMYSTKEIILKNIPLSKREEQRKSINKIIYSNDLGKTSIPIDSVI